MVTAKDKPKTTKKKRTAIALGKFLALGVGYALATPGATNSFLANQGWDAYKRNLREDLKASTKPTTAIKRGALFVAPLVIYSSGRKILSRNTRHIVSAGDYSVSV